MRVVPLVIVLLQSSLITIVACGQETILRHPMDAVPIADCHIHLIDFLQNSGYLYNGREVPPRVSDALPAGSRHLRIELILRKMSECNISHVMLCGMPFVKKWSEDDPFRSTYYLHSSSRVVRARDTDYTVALALEDLRAADPQRFEKEFPRIYPFICGFNETDLGAVGMIIKRIKEFPGIWKGIGEVMSRHDDLTNLTLGERPRANHAALFRIYDFAGEHGLPVSLHHNLAPISHNGLDRGTRYLSELLDAFEEFPDTLFILCHAGVSRRVVISDLIDILDEQILAAHGDHVYVDLSWVVFEDYMVLKDDQGRPVKDEDGDPKIKAEWIELIEKYPDNFMLGSDVVGDFREYRGVIRRYNALLKHLKSGTREKVANGNFVRIAPKKGLTLPRGYVYPEERYRWYKGPLPTDERPRAKRRPRQTEAVPVPVDIRP